MIEDLLYKCPICKVVDGLQTEGKTTLCTSCGATVQRVGRRLVINDQSRDCAQWYDEIKATELTAISGAGSGLTLENGEIVYQHSKQATLLQGRPAKVFFGFAGIRADLEIPQELDRGRLVITNRSLRFLGERAERTFPLAELTCVTTDSDYFVFKTKRQPYFQIDFQEESALKYQDLCRAVLREFWTARGHDRIVEFQPRVTFEVSRRTFRHNFLGRHAAVESPSRAVEAILYAMIKAGTGVILKAFFGAHVEGAEHVPRRGPFVVVLNHEGYYDSFFAITLLPRKVSFLAKNSEYKDSLHRWGLRLFRSIPVRRHEIDPSAIRNALKVLRVGEPVGIFLEGERTWDGRLLAPKIGIIRFLLAAEVPVLPVRIKGSFELLPRWDSRLQKHKVTLTVGEPFLLTFRGDEVEAAGRFVMNRLAGL